MTLGGIAGLIAALAFAVLVVFICINLVKLSSVLSDVQETVKRLNTTIDIVTKDVDNLSIEVEGLLNKGNTLVDDVNQKVKKTDPLFTAIGDVGYTVSDLTDSANDLVSNLVNKNSKKNKNPIERIKNPAPTAASRPRRNRPSRQTEPITRPAQTDAAERYVEKTEKRTTVQQDEETRQATETLKQFINAEPSKTAGEIRIK